MDSMREYKVSGVIKFCTSKPKLARGLDFTSPYDSRMKLSSTQENDLSVQITLKADTDTEARDLAELELDRVCDIFSYFHEFPICEWRISGVTWEQLTPQGKAVKSAEFGFGVNNVVSLVKELEPKSIEELTPLLEKEYSPDLKDVMSMWREAVSTEAPLLKYLLLYRLMEFVLGKSLTEWVKAKEPSVEILPHRQGEITVYTYLRNHIHPIATERGRALPYTKIRNALPQLQNLVRQAIQEKYEANCY